MIYELLIMNELKIHLPPSLRVFQGSERKLIKVKHYRFGFFHFLSEYWFGFLRIIVNYWFGFFHFLTDY